jgi:pimeloyl-ACP methyl ester carboxylesterase
MELNVDDKTVYAATGGREFDPALPGVIFVHGSGMDHTAWQLQTRYFAWHGRAVLAVDLPGHGRSEGPALTSIEAMADWTGAVIAAAGLRTAAVVGHSLGTFIAIEAAVRFPDQVTAIGLCATAAKMPVHPNLLKSAQAGEQQAVDMVTSWGFDRRAHLGGHKAPGYWMLRGGQRILELGKAEALGVDLAAANDYGDALEVATKVSCPTIFVLGEKDRMTSVKAAGPLVDAIKDAQVEIIPECGHMMMVEMPDETLDALRRIM